MLYSPSYIEILFMLSRLAYWKYKYWCMLPAFKTDYITYVKLSGQKIKPVGGLYFQPTA